jgi:hypothetical protein
LVAGESATRDLLPRPRPRRFAVVEPLSGYFEELVAAGVVAVTESPEGQRAPLASLIVRDADNEPHGIVCAERTLRGWVVR